MDGAAVDYYKERALLEFSPSNPKLRMAIVDALIEAGAGSDAKDLAPGIIDYITSGRGEFAKVLEGMRVETEDEEQGDGEESTETNWQHGYL